MLKHIVLLNKKKVSGIGHSDLFDPKVCIFQHHTINKKATSKQQKSEYVWYARLIILLFNFQRPLIIIGEFTV